MSLKANPRIFLFKSLVTSRKTANFYKDIYVQILKVLRPNASYRRRKASCCII